MSRQRPNHPYAYQPDPAASVNDRSWTVGGPGTDDYRDKRYTKAEAEELAEELTDAPSDEFFGRMVVLPFRREVIHRLLSGNDTQSFTTDQYKRQYEKLAAETFRTGQPTLWRNGLAEQHLRTSGLVWEARPGVLASVAESTNRA